MSKKIKRDEFGQPAKPTDLDYAILAVLEEVSSVKIDPEKTLLAFVADIRDVIARATSG